MSNHVMFDMQADQEPIEVCASELPSQCNIYLSGKRSSDATARRRRAPPKSEASSSPPPSLRFATDRHSLTLTRVDSSEEGDGVDNRGRFGGDEYSLSVARLPSSPSSSLPGTEDKSAAKQSADTKHGEENEGHVACLAHSSAFWEDSGDRRRPESGCLEVFAVTRIPPSAESNDAKEHKSSSDSNSLITHGSHSLSEGGKDGGDAVVEASTAADSSAKNNDIGGDKQLGGASSSNYFLMVKSKVLQETDTQANDHLMDGVDNGAEKSKSTTRLEAIPLDFRPMSVHATELHTTFTDSNRNDDPSRCTSVGVFVASVDDNKLRLYAATKDALLDTAASGPRFVPVPLCDAPSPAASQRGDDDVPLSFTTPIMAMDACVTADEEEPSETNDGAGREKGGAEVNRLAVACYDGTLRVLTYQLKVQGPNIGNWDDSALDVQFCLSRCSTFVVDGPVVALHFGVTALQSPSLFLVAGSLCGFACVFYETSTPLSDDGTQNGGAWHFDGPLTVVDGLYDARGEGYEDCVTSVHVMCCGSRGRSRHAIAVGTQGGRLLLFRQRPEEENTRDGDEDETTTFERERDELASMIEQNENEISPLQSEEEEMSSRARVLDEVISEKEIPVSRTTRADSLQVSSSSEGGDATDDADDEEGSDEATTKTREQEEAEPTHDIDGMPHFDTKLESTRMEGLLLERGMSDRASEITERTSAAEDLAPSSGTGQRRSEPGGDSIRAAGIVARRTHRYELLWERRLPYPIHGIASSAREGGGGDLLVSTRRSFHVFRCFSPGVSHALVVDKVVESLEENVLKLLAG